MNHHAFALGTAFQRPSEPNGPGAAVWRQFDSAGQIADTALLGPHAWLVNLTGRPDAVTIGDWTCVRGILRAEPAGEIRIGAYSYVGDDCILSAAGAITVGNDVLIAHGCQIFDNPTHPIDWRLRAAHYRAIVRGQPFSQPIPARPVTIADHAWLGMNTLVMPGVRIGARAIVAAGSVVLNDVADDVMVGGNPARVIRDLSVA